MNEILKENEVLDDLQLNNLMIIQNKLDYRFTSDSVLLANFAKVGHKDLVVEFCSGSGVISILLNEKCKPKQIVGFEIQEKLCEMSNRSLKYNKIENIEFLNKDLKQAEQIIGNGKVDVVVCNPPYYLLPKNQNDINEKYKLTKYEVLTSLTEILENASKILKYSGKLYLVHISSRIQEILSLAQKFNLICKKMQFIYPTEKKSSHLVLMCFSKGGKCDCEVLKPNVLN